VKRQGQVFKHRVSVDEYGHSEHVIYQTGCVCVDAKTPNVAKTRSSQSWAKTAGGMRAVLVVLVMLVMLPRGCDSGLLFGRACVAGARRAAARRAGLGATRAVLCAGSIGRACDSGMFTVTQLEYMRASRDSCDARDVVWHRAVTRLVDAHGPDRVRNNAIMHALEDADRNETAKAHRHGRGRRRG